MGKFCVGGEGGERFVLSGRLGRESRVVDGEEFLRFVGGADWFAGGIKRGD